LGIDNSIVFENIGSSLSMMNNLCRLLLSADRVDTGALKILDVKMTDVKLTDQMTGHENAGHEIAGQKRP